MVGREKDLISETYIGVVIIFFLFLMKGKPRDNLTFDRLVEMNSV